MSEKSKQFEDRVFKMLNRARTKKAFERVLAKILSELGMTHYEIWRLDPKYITKTISTNMPEGATDYYEFHKWEEWDWVPHLLLQTLRPIFHSEIYDYVKTSPIMMKGHIITLEVNQHLMLYEFHESYSYVEDEDKSRGDRLCLTLRSESMRIEEFQRRIKSYAVEVSIITKAVFYLLRDPDYLFNLCTERDTSDILTETQLKVLFCMSYQSMTQQQTAEATGLAESTVKTYCKHIKNKLEVTTIAGAAHKALVLDLFKIDLCREEREKISRRWGRGI